MTSWRMSPCVKSGKLDCMHCHTSSGRYRFKGDEKPNAACLPCHQEKVENATAHTHHKADSTGNRCIACHMPMTDFARMTRSDHSMRPPTPAATLKFKSPNACNICHKDKDPAWADQQVRQWHSDDYQKPVLERAALVDAARRGDWRRLGDILAYIGSKDRDEIFAASLIRLLYRCESAGQVAGPDQSPSGGFLSAGARCRGPGTGWIRDRGIRQGIGQGDGGRVSSGARAGRGCSGRHPGRATPRRASGGGRACHDGVAGGAPRPSR